MTMTLGFISAFQTFMSGSLFYVLLINFVLICVFFVINRRDIAKQFKKIKKHTWFAFIIIFILGSYLRFSSPGCSATDGLCFNYVKTATDMLETQNVGDLMHPKAYSLLLAIGFLFDQNYSTVYYFNLIISSLTIFLVFLLAYVIFKREDVALFSSLIYSLLPISILYAKLNASEVTAVFFFVMTVIIYLISIDLNKKNLYFLFFLLVVFSLQTRTDTSTFFLLFIGGFILNRKKIRMHELRIPLTLFIIFMIPASYYYIVGDSIYGPQSSPYFHSNRTSTVSLSYIIPNIQYDLSNNLIVPTFYPTILYIFLLFSFFFVLKERGVLYLILLAAGFLLFYGLWWATIYTDPMLYQLALQPTLAILMGYGICRTKEYIEKIVESRHLLKISSTLKYTGILITLSLIIIVFQTSTNVFSLKTNGECFIESIVYFDKYIGDNDCLLFENESSQYFNRHTKDILKILLPNKNLGTSLSECVNKEIFYVYVNETICPHTFFEAQKPVFDAIKNNYAMKIIEKKGCITLYKIEDNGTVK